MLFSCRLNDTNIRYLNDHPRMNHTIRPPMDSSLKWDASIIAASETQVSLLVRYRDDYVSVWNGHPLIPSSWKEIFLPKRLLLNEYCTCALSSDGQSLCFGLSSDIEMNVIFKCYDITTGQWTDMCTIDDFSIDCIVDTSLGWLTLGIGGNDPDTFLKLHKLTQGEAVLLRGFSFDNHPMEERTLLGYNKLYIYSKPDSRLRVYQFESMENPQHLVCQEQFGELCETNGSLYSVVYSECCLYSECWRASKINMDAAICTLQKDVHSSRVPLFDIFGRSMFDCMNIYTVSHTDRDVYLSIRSHKPPSLETLAVLRIQKMFGIRRQLKFNLPRRCMVGCLREGRSVCQVWEGGITMEEFRDRFGYRGKLF